VSGDTSFLIGTAKEDDNVDEKRVTREDRSPSQWHGDFFEAKLCRWRVSC
jgi:hypothetical protein